MTNIRYACHVPVTLFIHHQLIVNHHLPNRLIIYIVPNMISDLWAKDDLDWRGPHPIWKNGQNLPLGPKQHINRYMMYTFELKCWTVSQWICCFVLYWSGLIYRCCLCGRWVKKWRNTEIQELSLCPSGAF